MTRIFTAMLFALAAATAIAQPEPSISFTLDVTVLDPTGQPIPDCPVIASTYYQAKFNMTGPDGTVSLPLHREPDESYAVFMLHPGTRLWADEQQRDLAIARFHTLRGSYAFRDVLQVNVAQQGDPATATIQALPAVTVEGHITRPDGSHFDFDSWVLIRGYCDYARALKSDGLFSLEGVPQGHPVELWISGEGTEMHSVFLNPVQTANNIDLGDIVIEDVPKPSAIEGTVQGASDLVFPADAADVHNRLSLENSITLVRADGQSVHSLDLNGSGKIIIREGMGVNDTDIPMAEGEFYIVPGGYPASTTSLALLDSVRAGRQAQLDTAGVPKYTFVAGKTTQVAFDAQAAVNAVMSVGADLLR